MKPILLSLAVVAIAATVQAQSHTAALLDLRDAQLTPTIGTTLYSFPKINVGKFALDPSIWGLGAYDLQAKRFSVGLALVAGLPISNGWEVFGGIAGQWTVDNRLKLGPVVGFDIRF